MLLKRLGCIQSGNLPFECEMHIVAHLFYCSKTPSFVVGLYIIGCVFGASGSEEFLYVFECLLSSAVSVCCWRGRIGLLLSLYQPRVESAPCHSL